MKKKLTIKSKIENISIVENFIDNISMELSLKSDIYGNVLISTIEAVTNAIVHGNNGDHDKVVDIDVIKNKKELKITIKDQGEGFNLESVPDPTKPAYIEQPDGRGIFLMKNLSDKIEFKENGSTVILIFNI